MMDNIMQTLNTKKDLMHWQANVDEDSIAWLRLQTDGKSVNVLTPCRDGRIREPH